MFLTWYGGLYPLKIPEPSDCIRAAARKFPNLATLSRSEQKQRAQDMLRKALAHESLMNDPGTDTREVQRWV